eukprot:1384892-Alexandrium_andersonii.AAC.1
MPVVLQPYLEAKLEAFIFESTQQYTATAAPKDVPSKGPKDSSKDSKDPKDAAIVPDKGAHCLLSDPFALSSGGKPDVYSRGGPRIST